MKFQVSWLVAGAVSMVVAKPVARAGPTYFFTLGDSYTSTSFSASGTQPSASNPMGNPQLGVGTTTGGLNWVGYLTTAQNTSQVLSYNLAVGGAVIDNELVATDYRDDLVSQVAIFQNTYASKPASAPWTAKNAVFGFWIGINDVGNSFWKGDADTFTPKLVARIRDQAQEIYDAGGRKFLFLNVPPTGRAPLFLNQGEDTVNTHAAYLKVFNDNLKSMVKKFKASHSDATVVSYDAWSFMTKVMDNPGSYGFPDATCINEDGTSCLWWNDYHPSAKYQQLQAKDMKSVLGPLGAW